MRYLSLAVVLLLLAAFIAFAVVNGGTVEIRFPFSGAHIRAPLFLLMLGIYVLGMFTGGTFFDFVRRSVERAQIRRRD